MFSNSNNETRVSSNYRMPTQQKRPAIVLNEFHSRQRALRSPLAMPKRRFSQRRHSTPLVFTGRSIDSKFAPSNFVFNDFHKDRRRSRSLVKRFHFRDEIQPPRKISLNRIPELSPSNNFETNDANQNFLSQQNSVR